MNLPCLNNSVPRDEFALFEYQMEQDSSDVQIIGSNFSSCQGFYSDWARASAEYVVGIPKITIKCVRYILF